MKATKSLYILSWLLLFPFIVHAGDVPGTYSNYQWDPTVTALTSVDYDINVQVDPGYRSNVRWSNRFNLVGTSNGGYTGLETTAHSGHLLLFSVRGATQYKTGSTGSYCVTSGSGEGRITCRLPYNWETGVKYQFHLAYEGGQWLGVTVTNTYTNQSVKIGSILSDATSISPTGMASGTTYLEGRSPDSSCYNQPYSDVFFYPPSGNEGQYTATVSSTGTKATCAKYSQVLNWEQVNAVGNLLRGVLQSQNDKLCMDAGNGYTSGVPVTTQPCIAKRGAGQAWVLAVDMTLRLQSNLCLDIANADPSSGAALVLDQCNGSPSQQWIVGPGGTMLLSNFNNSQYCVAEGSAGTQLTVQPCTGDFSQMWTIPLLPVLP
jgi:hypothetical protein